MDIAPRFSSRWASEEVPGIGSMVGERCSSHESAICPGVASWRSAIRASDNRVGVPTLGERIERNERGPGAGADVDQSVGRAVLEVITVLDRDDLRHFSRPGQLGRRDVRDANVVNLALALKVDEGTDESSIGTRRSTACSW